MKPTTLQNQVSKAILADINKMAKKTEQTLPGTEQERFAFVLKCYLEGMSDEEIWEAVLSFDKDFEFFCRYMYLECKTDLIYLEWRKKGLTSLQSLFKSYQDETRTHAN